MVQAVHGWTEEMFDQAIAESAARHAADRARHRLFAPTKTKSTAVNYTYQAKCAADSYAAKARNNDKLLQRYLADFGFGGKAALVLQSCELRTHKGRYFLPFLVWVACIELGHPNPIEGAIQALDRIGVNVPTDAYYYERAHFVLGWGYPCSFEGPYPELKTAHPYNGGWPTMTFAGYVLAQLEPLLPTQTQIDAVERMSCIKRPKFKAAAPAAPMTAAADYRLVQSDEIDFAALYAAQCAAQGITPHVVEATVAPVVIRKPVALMVMLVSMVQLSIVLVQSVCGDAVEADYILATDYRKLDRRSSGCIAQAMQGSIAAQQTHPNKAVRQYAALHEIAEITRKVAGRMYYHRGCAMAYLATSREA